MLEDRANFLSRPEYVKMAPQPVDLLAMRQVLKPAAQRARLQLRQLGRVDRVYDLPQTAAQLAAPVSLACSTTDRQLAAQGAHDSFLRLCTSSARR